MSVESIHLTRLSRAESLHLEGDSSGATRQVSVDAPPIKPVPPSHLDPFHGANGDHMITPAASSASRVAVLTATPPEHTHLSQQSFRVSSSGSIALNGPMASPASHALVSLLQAGQALTKIARVGGVPGFVLGTGAAYLLDSAIKRHTTNRIAGPFDPPGPIIETVPAETPKLPVLAGIPSDDPSIQNIDKLEGYRAIDRPHAPLEGQPNGTGAVAFPLPEKPAIQPDPRDYVLIASNLSADGDPKAQSTANDTQASVTPLLSAADYANKFDETIVNDGWGFIDTQWHFPEDFGERIIKSVVDAGGRPGWRIPIKGLPGDETGSMILTLDKVAHEAASNWYEEVDSKLARNFPKDDLFIYDILASVNFVGALNLSRFMAHIDQPEFFHAVSAVQEDSLRVFPGVVLTSDMPNIGKIFYDTEILGEPVIPETGMTAVLSGGQRAHIVTPSAHASPARPPKRRVNLFMRARPRSALP